MTDIEKAIEMLRDARTMHARALRQAETELARIAEIERGIVTLARRAAGFPDAEDA